MALLTALIGWAGILLNNRSFLSVYTFLLWIAFALTLVPGYLSYKTRTFNLEGKLNAQWSRALSAGGRARVQDALGCCGYYSPFVEATAGGACYARSVLPGCKAPFLRAQMRILGAWYAAAFAVCGAQVLVLATAVLCANHVTRTFGKGITPRRYRLCAEDVRADALGLMKVLRERGVGPVRRPGVARAGSSVASREDKVRYDSYYGEAEKGRR